MMFFRLCMCLYFLLDLLIIDMPQYVSEWLIYVTPKPNLHVWRGYLKVLIFVNVMFVNDTLTWETGINGSYAWDVVKDRKEGE